MVDWAALKFMLIDSIQLFKLIAIIAVPIAAMAIVGAWIVFKNNTT